MGKSTSTNVILKITGAILRVCLNIIFYVAVVWVIVTAAKYTFNFSYQLFGSVSAESEPGTTVEFQIAKGESTMDIANKLEVSNIIVNKYSFYLKTKFKEYNVYPGTYVLNTSMDYDDILAVITNYKNSITREEDDKAAEKESADGTANDAAPEGDSTPQNTDKDPITNIP